MQTLRSVYISAAEWWWVIIVSGILVALTLIPLAWALTSNASSNGWHFMGMLANPIDGATYLSKIEQGREGAWLFRLRYTPEAQSGAVLHSFYLFLGHAGRVTGLSNLVIFHLTRVITGLFMFISLYQLGATVWLRRRPRRLFFTLTAVGSGLGWFLLLFNPDALAVDLSTPEAFPFYTTFANAHFPMSIALLALIASTFMVVYRRGYRELPRVDNGGLGLMLLSVLLALIQPPALIPFSTALAAYVAVRYYFTRQVPIHELRWAAMLWLPAIPFAVYYFSVFHFNEVMGEFNAQNITPSPAPYLYIFGYGLLLLVAIPGIVRAIRRFERDGDQLMLLWLIVNVIALYFPFSLQRRMAMGLILPLAYFDVRSLEDYWFYRVPEQWRAPGMIALIVFLVPTNVLILGIPLFGAVANPESGRDLGVLVEDDYWQTIEWLSQHGEPNGVVLASPNVSLWIPAYTEEVVVYGHPFETIHADVRRDQVEAWYRGQDCATLLGDDVPFRVRYIVWGPQEKDLREDKDDPDVVYEDTGRCIDQLPPARVEDKVTFGDVTLYVLR